MSPQPPNYVLSNVADLIHPDQKEWNAQLINATFLAFEAQQILQTQFSLNNLRDSFIYEERINKVIFLLNLLTNSKNEEIRCSTPINMSYLKRVMNGVYYGSLK